MSLSNVLVQLDSDPQPSVFDAVAAVDSGVAHLLRHGDVTVEGVRDLVYGAMFTRGPNELKHTAIFIGGSNVTIGERLLKEVCKTFFGPMRVSVMLDANGANTTAAAAVLAAERHVPLAGANALVLAGTGPVGQRVARLLAGAGAKVRLGSRQLQRADEVAAAIRERLPQAAIEPFKIFSEEDLTRGLAGAQIVVAAGPPGVQLLPAVDRAVARQLKVAIDLNAVPPLGIEGIQVQDKAQERDGALAYGAIGVGGTKMKIHRASVQRLFQSNDAVLDAEQIFEIGRQLLTKSG